MTGFTGMFRRIVSFVRRQPAKRLYGFLTTLAFVTAFLTLPGMVTHAADPTDAAGWVATIPTTWTALAVVASIVGAYALLGLALFAMRRSKTAVR